MKSNRRKFIQNLSLGTGGALAGIPGITHIKGLEGNTYKPKVKQGFNMCGYKAPKLDKVRIGLVGLGNRGSGAVKRLSQIANVEIIGLCDKDLKRVEKQQAFLEKVKLPKALAFSGDHGWKAMCEHDGIDLIYNCTPWSLHTPIAVYAMEHGKHTTTEVPAAKTIDECWQLVETSEKTKKHCMMLENTCYDFFEQMTLNMAQLGVFGELVHAEGAYIHNLIESNFSKTAYTDMWRLRENANRNGNLYPTHGLGPISQCLNINRGDKFEHLVAISSNDFQMASRAVELATADPFYKEFVGKPFRGNMNTLIIKTYKGKTILLQHDVTSTRPYSRIHLLSGTKGIVQKWPEPGRIALGEDWMNEKDLKEIEEKYTTPLVKHIGDIAKKVGGHGGMDFIMDWRLIDSLRNGLPLDQDVYDAAAWSVISHASEISIVKRGKSIDIPDFTRGAWISNPLVNLTLDGGATTTIRSVS